MTWFRIASIAAFWAIANAASAGTIVHGSYSAVLNQYSTVEKGDATGAVGVDIGLVEVEFAVDVSQCAYVATLGDFNYNGKYGSPGFVSVAAMQGNPNAVLVQTTDRKGHPRRKAFHLDVGC